MEERTCIMNETELKIDTHTYTSRTYFTHTQPLLSSLPLPSRLSPSLHAPTVEDVYRSTTASNYTHKQADHALHTTQSRKAPGHWRLHYTLDTLNKVWVECAHTHMNTHTDTHTHTHTHTRSHTLTHAHTHMYMHTHTDTHTHTLTHIHTRTHTHMHTHTHTHIGQAVDLSTYSYGYDIVSYNYEQLHSFI